VINGTAIINGTAYHAAALSSAAAFSLLVHLDRVTWPGGRGTARFG
jgi:hypothetical protein